MYKADSTEGASSIAMSPALPSGSGSAATVVRQVNITDDDAVLLTPTLDGVNVLYAFGRGAGNVGIVVWLLMGQVSSGEGGALLQGVFGWCNSQGVSSSKKLVTLSMGGTSFKYALGRMQVLEGQPEWNIQPVYFGGVIVNPPTQST